MWGMAMKATYGVFGDKKLFIYKDPKTDSGLKKSHKGCCRVWYEDGIYHCEDQHLDYVPEDDTALKKIFGIYTTPQGTFANEGYCANFADVRARARGEMI